MLSKLAKSIGRGWRVLIARTPLINFRLSSAHIHTHSQAHTYVVFFSRLSNGKSAATHKHTRSATDTRTIWQHYNVYSIAIAGSLVVVSRSMSASKFFAIRNCICFAITIPIAIRNLEWLRDSRFRESSGSPVGISVKKNLKADLSMA